MFQRLGGKPENLAHLERIEEAVRTRFRLPDDALVLVSEERSDTPGFPAHDTTVRFWTDPDRRYRLRIFKPVRDITPADLPVAWLLPSLLDDGDPDCC
jgi:nitrate reductase delta subunit